MPPPACDAARRGRRPPAMPPAGAAARLRCRPPGPPPACDAARRGRRPPAMPPAGAAARLRCRPPGPPPACDAARRGRRPPAMPPAGAAARLRCRPPGPPPACDAARRGPLCPPGQRWYQRGRWSDNGGTNVAVATKGDVPPAYRDAVLEPTASACRRPMPYIRRGAFAATPLYAEVPLPRPRCTQRCLSRDAGVRRGAFAAMRHALDHRGGNQPRGSGVAVALTRATRGLDALRYGGARGWPAGRATVPIPSGGGRLAQRESASFTPRRSLVRSQYRPPAQTPL